MCNISVASDLVANFDIVYDLLSVMITNSEYQVVFDENLTRSLVLRLL